MMIQEREVELSMIIPARNEERRLHTGFEAYSAALSERYGDHFEMVIVTNGCTDACGGSL